MRVIHLGTKVFPEFGIIDDNGNLVQNVVVSGEGQQPLKVSVFNEQAFINLFNQLQKTQAELIAQTKKLEEKTEAMKASIEEVKS